MHTSKTQSVLVDASFWRRVTVSLLHFLCITIPLFFLFNTDELFEFNKMMLTYGLTLLIGVSYTLALVFSPRFKLPTTFLDLPIALFVASQVLSTLFSIHPFTSFFGYYSRFHGGLLSTLTYCVLYYAAVGTLRQEEVKKIWQSLIISGVLVSIYGILEHFGHSFSCLLVTKGASFGVDCWVQDVRNRVFASFGQPNWLAAYLIGVLPLSYVLLFTSKQRWIQVVYGLATIAMTLALIYTASRSGLLAYGAVLAMLSVYGCWQFLKSTQKHSFIPLALTGVLSAALLLWYPTPFSQVLSRRLFLAATPVPATVPVQPLSAPVNRLEVGGTDSGEIRKIVWTGAYRVWQRYPLLGSGVETFAYSYYLDRPVEHNYVSEWDFLYNKAHNEFLNFLATTGILGLSTYCVFLGASVWLYVRNIRDQQLPSSASWNSIGLLAATAALTISNFFGFSTVSVGILLFLLPACAGVLTKVKEPAANARSFTLSDTTSLTILTLAALVVLSGLGVLFRFWSADIQYTAGKNSLLTGDVRKGFTLLEAAAAKNPNEALFTDTLATEYANYTAQFAQAGEQTTAATLAAKSLSYIRKTLELNQRHLNFYKTSARSLIILSQFDDHYLQAAQEVLVSARALAPTDPKIVYNLGLVEIGLGNTQKGTDLIEESIRLKPDYDTARAQLATEYEKTGDYDRALSHLHYIVEYINPQATEIKERIASLSAAQAARKK